MYTHARTHAHTHTHDTHRVKPTCRWPCSPPVGDPLDHVCCQVQHLVLVAGDNDERRCLARRKWR